MLREKKSYSLKEETNRKAMREGLRDGIPIGLGYFAVSFSLGIAARNIGLTPFQSFLASLLCNASAGEFAGFTMIAAGGTYLEMAVITLIANARYLLMSCALAQRFDPDTRPVHRFLVAFDITDEIFGVTIARPGRINPVYTYGVIFTAAPCWAFGTALGCLAGNIMPARLVSALSVALYGMFLAIIIPPGRKNKVIAGLVGICFAASYAASVLPWISGLSGGTRTIILTVVISTAAALIFPRKQTEEEAA